VYITSERPLEPQFEPYRIRISPLDIHHALYFANMYVGDSQTMTAEAAVLGTPAVRFNDFVGELSYLEELEHRFHLTRGIRTSDPAKLLTVVQEHLATPGLKNEWEQRRQTMLAQSIDLAQFMTAMVMERFK
jgi:predicted glycosyltransferase